MRRADRLFQIIQYLRRHRVTTAARLAEELEVSERTIYRDMRDLSCSGVPLEAEAGVGYALSPGFDLPPLMFTEEEIEALVLGARVVTAWADPGLSKAAQEALARIEAALPQRLQPRISQSALFSPNFSNQNQSHDALLQLRHAVRQRRKVHFDYTRADGQSSQRIVRPLCLSFAAPLWLLSAWCELRQDFRNFRLDRLFGLTVLPETFADEPGRTLDDFFRHIQSED